MYVCKRSPNKNKYHSTADTYDYSTDYFNDPYNCRDLNPTQVPCTHVNNKLCTSLSLQIRCSLRVSFPLLISIKILSISISQMFPRPSLPGCCPFQLQPYEYLSCSQLYMYDLLYLSNNTPPQCLHAGVHV